MEDLLQKAGSQAVTFAIRSGISIASGYAIRTLTKFLDRLPESEKGSLQTNKTRLQTKITIITPAIDLIELISARGNTSLSSTLELTQELKQDIDEFEKKVDVINDTLAGKTGKEAQKATAEVQLYIRDLLIRIEEAIPLISLALTTSGANLSARLPDSVSPGRLLQASNNLSTADARYNDLAAKDRHQWVQIGPEFVLKLYTIFYGTARNPQAVSGDITWKEEFPKCRVRLWRVPNEALVYDYCMTLDEDLDDERYHESDEVPKSRTIEISLITRLFFTASGRLLEIEEAKTPVLVLKLNSTLDSQDGAIEWLAFEEYPKPGDVSDEEDDEDRDSDETDSEDESHPAALKTPSPRDSPTSALISRFESLTLTPALEPSLSLMEYTIRLAALQANDQESMYTIKDERISLYLRDESSSGGVATSNSAAPTSKSTPRSNLATPSVPRRSPMRTLSNAGSRRSSAQKSSLSPIQPPPEPPALNAARRRSASPQVPNSLRSSPKLPQTPIRDDGASGDEADLLTPWEHDRIKSIPLRRRLLMKFDGSNTNTPSKRPPGI